MESKKCEFCGWEHTEDNPVTYGPDPYGYEIHGDDTQYWICDDCQQQSAENI